MISSLILREMQAGTFNLLTFWERRIRRILPALVVVVLATLVAGWVYFLPPALSTMGRSVVAQMSLLSNVYFYREGVYGSGYFTPVFSPKPLLHTWSLAVEEQFYLFFPLLLAFLVQRRRPAFKEIILCLAIGWIALGAYSYYYYPVAKFYLPLAAWEFLLGNVAMLFLPLLLWFLWQRRKLSSLESLTCLTIGSFLIFLYGSYQYPAATFYLPPSRAWELLLGAVLALTRGRWQFNERVRERAGWLGLASVGATVFFYQVVGDFPRGAAIPACVGATLILFSSETKLSGVGRMLAWRPLVFIGLISYSLYLWHWPLLVISQYPFEYQNRATNALMLLLAFFLSVLSWKFVETPFRKGRLARKRGQIFGLAAGSVVALFVCGLAIACRQGFPSRFSSTVVTVVNTGAPMAFFKSASVAQILAGQCIEVGSKDTHHPVDLVIFGDSHAMSITPALDKLCRQHAWRGVEAARYNDPSIFAHHDRAGKPPDAKDWSFADAVIDYIRTSHPKNMVIAADWKKYPATDEYQSNVVSTVRAVLDSGTRVFLLKDYPEQESNLFSQLDYSILHGSDPGKIGITPEQHRETGRHLEKMFGQISGMGVTVLDPADYFLNRKGLYGAIRENHLLYWDDHHLTTEGAMVLVPLFEPIFGTNGLSSKD